MTLARIAALAAPVLLLIASDVSAQPARLARLYQGRREPEQSDRVTRKVRIGRDGSVSVSNVAGDIAVSTIPGDEVSIDAVKHGTRGALDRVTVVIDDRPGRVDISTEYGNNWRWNSNNISVDYTIGVPEGASVDLRSISGTVRVSAVKGSVRLQTISGNLVTANVPRVEFAKSVSGNIELNGVSFDGDLSVSLISGMLRANGLKARSLDINSVSGDVILRNAACERVNARAISGSFEYSGSLARNGRYDVSSHAGDVRFLLGDNAGFELNAGSFSGSVRSDYAATIDIGRGRGRGRGQGRGPGQTVQATAGDGSARLDLHTFSGNIVVGKR